MGSSPRRAQTTRIAITMEQNPYATPRAPVEIARPSSAPASPRAIVAGWEALRLRYNLILLGPGLLVVLLCMTQFAMSPFHAVVGAAFVAVGANLCFLLGPLAELYASAMLDVPEHPELRRIAFTLGLIVSLGAFGVACLLEAAFVMP